MTPDQERLVVDNLDLVRAIARQVSIRTRQDYDDLHQDGCVGLLDAAEKYDGRGNFRGYAYVRINGAIIDGMRRMDVVTRRSMHDPDAVYLQPMKSLDESLKHGEEWKNANGHTLADLIPDPNPGPEALAVEDDLVTWTLSRLTDREQAIYAAWLWDDRTMLSLAEDMGVTESRVSQIAGNARRRIRAELEDVA